MAVEKPRIKRADFFKLHVRRVTTVVIAIQLLFLGMLTGFLTIFADLDLGFVLIYILTPLIALQVAGYTIVLRYALEPLNLLAQAVTHVSKESAKVTRLNLNKTYHETTGLKSLVDTIYEVAAGENLKSVPGDDVEATFNQTLLENIPCGIIALNEKREVIYANSSAPVKPNDDGQKVLELMFNNDDSLESWLTHVEIHELSGSKAWVRVQNVLPGEEDRKLYDVYANYHKNAANGIETLLICLDRTSYYGKDEEDMDFIALAAHELRGPITVIRGYLDVLNGELQPVMRDDQKELFERLEVSASRLSGYVSNILNVSRYDRRHLKIHLREDKLDEIYASIADDLALRASTHNRMLSVSIPTDLPTIAADRNSLTEVMANLVDNAIKYSNEGGQVEVSAAVDGEFVTFSVVDHGIGIPSSVLSNLFTKFYRSHRSRQTVPGTGLGLYISKAIVESHGGHVNLSSSEGQGSTFGFSIPIYSTVADKLLANDNENQGIMESGSGWIKNHSMIKQ